MDDLWGQWVHWPIGCTRGVQTRLSPVLAGRNPVAIKLLAQETGLDYRVFSLTESAEVERAMDGISLVLHCAGPFSQTSQPMIEVCLAKKLRNTSHGQVKLFKC